MEDVQGAYIHRTLSLEIERPFKISGSSLSKELRKSMPSLSELWCTSNTMHLLRGTSVLFFLPEERMDLSWLVDV